LSVAEEVKRFNTEVTEEMRRKSEKDQGLNRRDTQGAEKGNDECF